MTRKLAALAVGLALAGCPTFPEGLCNTDEDCPGSSCNLESGLCRPQPGDEDGGAPDGGGDGGSDAGTDGGPSCETPCDGPCQLCFEGTCFAAAAGTEDPACEGHLCDGVSQACPTGCETDADCASTHFCAGQDCHQRLPDGLACSGDSQCESEHCVAGVCCDEACTGSGPCVLCDDGDPCTDAACDPVTGVCSNVVVEGNACDDGNACTELDLCDAAGRCVGGNLKACDDGDPCTDDACDPGTGACQNALDPTNRCPDVDNDVCTVEACTVTGACVTTINPSCCLTSSAPNFTGLCGIGESVWLPDGCDYAYTHYNASGSCTFTQYTCRGGTWGSEYTDGGEDCGHSSLDEWNDDCDHRSAKTVSCN